ncbi:hypothetical protein IJS77_03490 [bacterium]|nr:hypothetical protein [bacterium]
MRIMPIIYKFNPKRAIYKIGNTVLYTNREKEVVEAVDGFIHITGAKKLGLSTDTALSSAKIPRIIVKDSSIGCIYGNNNHHVFLHNCTFITNPKIKPKFEHTAQIIYTNKP